MVSAAGAPVRGEVPSRLRLALAAALATRSIAVGLGLFALCTGIASTSRAQEMQDRARAAAAASRAKSSDSDRLQSSYVIPGLSGGRIVTVDASAGFASSLACQKTAKLLEILVQPGSGGDLAHVSISRDSDLDGGFDQVSTLPVPVSGICANGIVSCAPGSWDQCRSYAWSVGSGGTLALDPVEMPALSACYCINNSCGTNLATANLSSVLSDIGGGIVGALTAADPRIGVAKAVIDGPVISYVGAQTTACTSASAVPQTRYAADPIAMTSDAAARATSEAVFTSLSGSVAGSGRVEQQRACTIERELVVSDPRTEDIITRNAGGYATIMLDPTHVRFQMGSPSDNSIRGGRCQIFDYVMTLDVRDMSRLKSAAITRWYVDDWAQIHVDGVLVASGPDSWTGTGVPPGKCETKETYSSTARIDLLPWLTQGRHEIRMRVAVADEGEAYAQVDVEIDGSCRLDERLVDLCQANAQDKACRLISENVDGVVTVSNGVQTGLRPLAQTRIMGAGACQMQLTRDFFSRARRYSCVIDTGMQAPPDLSRGAWIIDHSSETLLADRTVAADGSVTTSTRAFALPERGTVPACEAICKTRAPRANVDAAPDGVVGAKQNDPVGWDNFYHVCSADNICPVGPGEALVQGCGCLDDFPEAAVMMQTVRLAGADLACTGTQAVVP